MSYPFFFPLALKHNSIQTKYVHVGAAVIK